MRKIYLNVYEDKRLTERYLKRNPKQNPNYKILVGIGTKTYYFTNREKCNRFRKQFEKYITESYRFFLQMYGDTNAVFSSLFPWIGQSETFKIKNIFKSMLDVFDLAFTDFKLRDNDVLVNWVFWFETQLQKVLSILKHYARKSRNQSELTRIVNLRKVIKFHNDSFFVKHRNFEYKNQVSSSECEVIDLYNPLQLAINF